MNVNPLKTIIYGFLAVDMWLWIVVEGVVRIYEREKMAEDVKALQDALDRLEQELDCGKAIKVSKLIKMLQNISTIEKDAAICFDCGYNNLSIHLKE